MYITAARSPPRSEPANTGSTIPLPETESIRAATGDPRGVALIGLVDACDLLSDIFPDRNTDQIRQRVEQLRTMGLIARELAGAISDIEHNVKMALSGAFRA